MERSSKTRWKWDARRRTMLRVVNVGLSRRPLSRTAVTCPCGRRYVLALTSVDHVREVSGNQIVLLAEAPSLTQFQIRLLTLVAGGMTDREAARTLNVSVSRVRYGMRDLITRMSARTRSEAVFLGVAYGFLE